MSSTQIVRVESNYPMTRSQTKRIQDAEIILSNWKKIYKIESVDDEISLMQKFNGKSLPVYQPTWHSNKHQPFQYQSRDMTYIGDETFTYGDVADGDDKMFVIAKPGGGDWLLGFQFKMYNAFSREGYSGFLRLELAAVHK
jgi:hypothetical protein